MSDQAQAALLLCDRHREEEMDMYCKTCKRPTCTECLKTDHQGHDFDTISKLYRKIRSRRLDLLKEIEMKVNPMRTKNRRHANNVKCRNKTLLKRNIESAEKQRTELHKAVDDIIDSHVTNLTKCSTKLGEEINKEVDFLEKDESEVIKMLETFEKTTMVGLDLIEYYERLRTKVDTLQTLDISQYRSKQVFREGKLDRTSLNKMIGEVTEISTSINSVELISSFQHCDSLVQTISPISENEAWFTYINTNEINLLRCDGHHLKPVKNSASGNSFIPHGSGILVCNRKQKNILKIDMSGKSTPWIDTSPLEAKCLAEALDGKILISLRDEYSGTRTKHSQRCVRMVTPSGDTLKSYEYGEDGRTPVLTSPLYVTQNGNSDVCVVNMYVVAQDEWRGHVCVFYEDGGFKFKYSGHSGEFFPYGLCCDSVCNIISVNQHDDTIHVVSSEGLFLKYLFTRDTYVPDPMSLALYRGVLWVGFQGGEVHVYRYKF